MASNADEFASMIHGLEQAGLSKREIVRQSGLSRMSVWRYSVGDGRNPSHESYQRLDRLCRKVGVDPAPPNLTRRRG